jgi:penicillin-binding protein 1A
MHDLDFISDDTFLQAKSEPITANRHRLEIELEAPYVSEMVREYMVEQYGKAAYESGYRVYTTVDSNLQQSANKAIVDGLIGYGERHGFKGASGRIDPVLHHSADKRIIELQKFPAVSNLQPVMVLRPGGDAIEVLTSTGVHKSLSADSWRWTNKSPSQLLHPGDVVYLFNAKNGARLANIPKVQGALVSLSPSDGSILALTGGFDFRQSRFNRVTQAQRQPGSNIKPFIYSSAIANGFTASTLVSGAPIVIEDDIGGAWRPQNYSKKVFGPTRLRKALSLSLNLVSVRLVRALGIDTVRTYLGRFGFDSERLPKGLSLALGSATVTPMEIARGYASFANGGYLIKPFLIARIEDQNGAIVEYANKEMICPDCPAPQTKTGSTQNRSVDSRFAPRIISEENAFIIDSLMKEVVSNGTAKAALQLNRSDLAGKTGTTNNYFDAWFTGYNPDVVTSVWVGFDSPQDLGKGESGARAALPIWIDYMRVALKDRPDLEREIPEKIVELRTNPISGLRATEEESDAYLEFFVRGSEPPFPDPESLIDPIQGLF